MIRVLLFWICMLHLSYVVLGAILWSQNFEAIPSNFYTTSNFTRSLGNTYACVTGNYVYYTSGSYSYFITNTFHVPQEKGIRLTFDSRRVNSSSGTIQIYYLITGACAWDRLNPTNNGWVLWGTITPNTSTASPGGCTTQSLTLEGHVCGGQSIAVLFYCPSATSTNWIAIDNIVIEDNGPVTDPVPIIQGTTVYQENFTTNYWYGPVDNGLSGSGHRTSGVKIPYRSYRSSSSAYVYLWNNGSGGTANHSGVSWDYYAALYSGFEYCGTSVTAQIITRELNTSLCPSCELRFAFRSQYPTTGTYGYTFDENYQLYAPYVYYSTGQGYSWVQIPVNYYFPNGLWNFAAYQLPSAANVKIRFARGASNPSPVGIDNIKVLCRDCSISTLSGGTIYGPTEQLPNTDYTFSIDPTPGATYYRWMIRAIDQTPPVIYENNCPDGGNPCIVSGQGTTTVVINFGNTPANYRVMCIPYDAHPGTLSNPSDACYAKISIFNVPLPVQLISFHIEDIDGKPLLVWETASESNNESFRIYHATNRNGEFQFLHSIKGAGNSNEVLSYYYFHNTPAAGENIYRLVQVDYDGKETTLGELAFLNEHPYADFNVAFQDGFLMLHFGPYALGEHFFELYTWDGKFVKSFRIHANPFAIINFHVGDISPGIYFLKITNYMDLKALYPVAIL